MTQTALSIWRAYAACWSAPPDTRAEAIGSCLADDVRYRDPGDAADGVDQLASYMEGFRQAFQGTRFVIDRVDEHHHRSLAQWRQVAADESVQTRGASFAVHAEDGRLLDVTGFFFATPDPEEQPT